MGARYTQKICVPAPQHWTGKCISKRMNSLDDTGSRPVISLLYTSSFIALTLLTLSLIAPIPTLAGAIYKSIDKDGNVIFTDQPLEGAENLNPQSPENANNPAESDEGGLPEDGSNVDAYEPPKDSVALTPEPKNPPKSDYKEEKKPTEFLPVTVVEILTPIHNATLQDPIGKIWVELQSYPTPLKKTGLTAQLWMDDQLVASGKRPMLSLPAPERGTHALQVKLVDDKGRLFLTSDTTHIHVKYRVSAQ